MMGKKSLTNTLLLMVLHLLPNDTDYFLRVSKILLIREAEPNGLNQQCECTHFVPFKELASGYYGYSNCRFGTSGAL